MAAYLGHLWITRLLFQRGLAAIYLVAFISALNQFKPLLGERGLLPVPSFLQRAPFRRTLSLFHLHYSDRFFTGVVWTGIGLSLVKKLVEAQGGSVGLESQPGAGAAFTFTWPKNS
jgi:hypothetical protein